MGIQDWAFAKAVRRQLAATDGASFFIVQEKSTNVRRDLTLKDTDGSVYEIKGEDAADMHDEMLKSLDLIFTYIPRDEYVSYRRRSDEDAKDLFYDLRAPIE